MKAPNLTESDEIFELIDRINKIFKKNISCWKQFLKGNNLPDEYDRNEIRKLVRHTKAMNKNLRIEIDALNDFLQLIELKVKWIIEEINIHPIKDTPAFRLRGELLCQKNRAIKSIKEIDLLFKDR